MDKLLEQIHDAQGLDDLVPLIDALSRDTRAIMSRQQMSADDIQRLLRPFETMRLLLSHLYLNGAGPDEDQAQIVLIRNLVQRCLDVEGLVKEARNDQVRPKYPQMT